MARNVSDVQLNISATDKSRQAFEAAQRSLKGVDKSLNKAQQSTKGLGAELEKLGDKFSKQSLLGFVSIAAGVGIATKAFAKFQATVEETQIITNQIKFMGVEAKISMEKIDDFGVSIGSLADSRKIFKMLFNGREAMAEFSDEFVNLAGVFDNLAKTTGFNAGLQAQRLGRIAQGSASAFSRMNTRLDLFNKSELVAIKRMQLLGQNAEITRRTIDKLKDKFGEIDVGDMGVPFRQLGASTDRLWESLGETVTLFANPLIELMRDAASDITSILDEVNNAIKASPLGISRDVESVAALALKFGVDLTEESEKTASNYERIFTSLKGVLFGDLGAFQDKVDTLTVEEGGVIRGDQKEPKPITLSESDIEAKTKLLISSVNQYAAAGRAAEITSLDGIAKIQASQIESQEKILNRAKVNSDKLNEIELISGKRLADGRIIAFTKTESDAKDAANELQKDRFEFLLNLDTKTLNRQLANTSLVENRSDRFIRRILTDREKFANQMEALDKKSMDASLELFEEEQDARDQRSKDQIAAEKADIQSRIENGAVFLKWQEDSAQEMKTMARTIGTSITESIGTSIAQSLVEGADGAEIFKAAMRGLAVQVISSLINIAAQQVIMATIGDALKVKSAGVAIASNVAVTASAGPAGAALALATAGTSATTAAGLYSSSLATMITANAALLSPVGIAHGGLTNVPSESTYLLDKGERVLSPNQNRDLTDFISTKGKSGGDVNVSFNVSAIDGSGIKQLLAKNMPFIAGQIQQATTRRLRRNG